MYYYQFMAALEDENTQKKGIVNVIYNVDCTSINLRMDKETFSAGSAFVEALPFRIVAMHFCYNNERLLPIMSFIQLAVGQQNRIRFRAHFGM